MVDRRRQWRAENQPIKIDKEVSDNEVIIEGSEGDKYYVNINIPFCDCPDWEKRKPNGGCKHIIKSRIKTGDIAKLPNEKTNSGRYTNRTEYSGNWRKISNQTKKRDHWTCQKCGSKGGKYGDAELHAHHIVPKSKGGADKSNNLITLCRKCHEKQHGHSIGFDGTQSNDKSVEDTRSINQINQPSTSDSDTNSEQGASDTADRSDDKDEQYVYYDVEPGLHPDSAESWAVKDSPPLEQNVPSTNDNKAEGDLNAGKEQNKNEDSALGSVNDSHGGQSSTDTSKSTNSGNSSNTTSTNSAQEDNSDLTAFSQFLQGVPVTIFVISFIVGIAGTSWGIYQLAIHYVGNISQIRLYSVVIGLVVFSNLWFETWDYLVNFLETNDLSVTTATFHTFKIFLILTVAVLTPFLVLGYVTSNLLWSSIAGICGLIFCIMFFGRQYTEYD